ncbi:MAG: DoxX family protein [Bacteroidia bacterium]|nr:DoxX family protein [Bacteroidia bacterium]
MNKTITILYWGARIIAALILLQTLFFKFTASEESVYIFTKVGMEPWGRIGIGVLELIAGGMLLINATAWLGAGLALGLMGGAIMMHLTQLGIEVQGDGGYLFILALAVAACSLVVLALNKQKILALLKRGRR